MFSVPKQLISTFHVAVYAAHAGLPHFNSSKFPAKRKPPSVIKIFIMQLSRHKSQILFLCHIHLQYPSHHCTFFTSQCSTLPSACLYQKEEWALFDNLQSSIYFLYCSTVIINILLPTTPLIIIIIILCRADFTWK